MSSLTLSLNPKITQENKPQNIEIDNSEQVAQFKPMQTENAQNNTPAIELNTQNEQAPQQTQTLENANAANTQENNLLNNEEYIEFTKNRINSQNNNENINLAQTESNAFNIEDPEYQEYIKTKLKAKDKALKASKGYNERKDSFLPEKLQQLGHALDRTDAYKNASWGEQVNFFDAPRQAMERWQKYGDKVKSEETAIYDYLAEYGEENAKDLGIKKVDKELLKNAKLRKSIRNKDIKDLTKEEKDYLTSEETYFGRAIDFFRNDEKVTEERVQNLDRAQVDSEFLNKAIKLHSVKTSVLDLMNNAEEKEAQEKEYLKELGEIAKGYGYDTVAYDKKKNDYVAIKDGKKYYLDVNGFSRNFDKILVNNYYDVLLGSVPGIGLGAKAGQLGLKAGQIGIKKATTTLGKEALKMGAVSAVASPLDYLTMINELERQGSMGEMLKYAAGNAAASTVGTYAVGKAIHGIEKGIDLTKGLKDIDLSNIKVKNIFDNEEMAISRKLAKFNKSELDSNYQNFKNMQSDTIISKDIRQGGIIDDFIDKVNKYNPLERFTSKKESQERLLSSIFSNKELSREFAGQLTSEEAQIIHKAVEKMGDNFKNLSKEYEQDLINNYVKSGKTHIDSVPALYKELLSELDKEAKLNYSKSIKNLHDNLNDIDFKSPLLQGYKNITDSAIDSLGFENDLTKTLIRETQKLESKSNISLSEAIELRKDINEIIRNYEKSNSDLKKFRAKSHLESLKQNIDNSIKSALDSKVAQNEIKHDLSNVVNPREAHLNTAQQNNTLLDKNLIETNELIKEATPINKNINTLRQEVADVLTPKINKPIINNNDGTVATITRKTIKKTTSDKAIQKSINNGFTEEQHLNISKDLENLYKNATFKETTQDKNNYNNIQIHRYESKIDDNTTALITLKETKDGQYKGNRIYTLELENIARLSDSNSTAQAKMPSLNKDLSGQPLNSPQALNNHTTQTLTRQEADDLFNDYLNANAKYAQLKESFKDKLVKDMLKGMDKKTLDSKLTTEQWKKRVLDTEWGDSVKGLKGTIFEKFNPKMQEDTQMLFIFRALDRNINELSDNTPINFSKILNDLEKLENLQLAPKVYPVLELFKSYSKAYQFSQEIAKAKGLEMMHGGGAMATTLSGRLQVFMTNRLFKKLFAYIPYLGDNNAILKSLSKAIKDLKYPSEITLETLKQLKDADIKKGFKPNNADNNVPLNEITQTAIKSDKDLQNVIKHSKDKRILDSKTENELETLATNPHLLELENTHKYETQTLERQTQFFNSIDRTKDDLTKGDFVAKENIKQDIELINLIKDNLENNTVFTPDNVAMNIIKDEKTYTFIQDKHGISYIYELPKEKPTPPRTYDELRAKESADNAELQSYKDQTQTIIEKRKLTRYEPQNNTQQAKELNNTELSLNPQHKKDVANQELKETQTPQNQDLLNQITEKQKQLQQIETKLNNQTTQKGKSYYTQQLENLNKEIQQLEINAGIRTELNLNNSIKAKKQALQDAEYTITTNDNQKLIFTENEMDNIKKALHVEYITQPKELSPNFKHSLDSKVYIDLPKYFKSVDFKKARQIKELKNTLFNYDIALKDSNNNFYLFSKQGDKYFTLKGEKENGDYYIKGNKNLTHNEILDKIKSGSEVLHSTDETIKSNKQTLKPNETIPYTKIRETSIQTEKMKEPVKADYVIIKKEHLKPNFTSENGLQYRNVKQQDVIKEIAENLKVEKLVNHEGSFQGLPLIQHDGQIISGNHRAEGLLNLNPTSRNNYEKAIKERFNIDLNHDELLVRRISDNVASDKILQLAKASNEGLENTLQEAVYTKLAKYEPYIKEIKEIHADNLESLKLEINTRLKGGPTDVQETNLALLASQMKDTSEFIYALNSIQKKNDSEKIYNILIDNAGSFYQINKAYNDLNISDLLQNSIQVLAHTKADTRGTFKRIADDFDFYLRSSNREAIKEQRRLMGLNPDPLKDFKAEILGTTLRRYITNNANPSEHLFNKIKTFKEYADEKSGFDLFGNKQEINDSLFVAHLYADVADTQTDIGFLLKVSDTMQQLESKKIGLSDINDRNIRAYIEKLPKQVNDKIKEIDLNNAKIKDIRADFLERLKPLFNIELENADGNKAYFNLRSLSKMLSEPAIQKSINNGFTREEHLNAVLQIAPLFKKSKLAKTEPHKSGEDNTIINRFNAEYKNANALITSKESLDDNKNRIYSLELELIPRF